MKVSVRKKQVDKKVIAKKPLTNLYEMNSKYMYKGHSKRVINMHYYTQVAA